MDGRRNVNCGFANLNTARVVEKVGSTIDMPRISSRQQHHIVMLQPMLLVIIFKEM